MGWLNAEQSAPKVFISIFFQTWEGPGSLLPSHCTRCKRGHSSQLRMPLFYTKRLAFFFFKKKRGIMLLFVLLFDVQSKVSELSKRVLSICVSLFLTPTMLTYDFP